VIQGHANSRVGHDVVYLSSYGTCISFFYFKCEIIFGSLD